MRFAVKCLSDADFAKWVAATKAGGGTLDRMAYLKLEKPSENVPAQRFAAVEPQLFDAIVNLCVEPGKMCMHDMMSIAAAGGAGIPGIHNVRRLSYDKFAASGTETGYWGQHNGGPLGRSPTPKGS